jgi:hypothetical protein
MPHPLLDGAKTVSFVLSVLDTFPASMSRSVHAHIHQAPLDFFRDTSRTHALHTIDVSMLPFTYAFQTASGSPAQPSLS